jgi:mannose-6-phosphate isomerase-like protein (cupin superfamily)
MTTIVPEQRTAGCHRRELEVILASASAGAAVAVVACTIPPATSGPPLHVHAASDDTFFVLSGVLLVHADGRAATIPEGGLVDVSRGMSHTFTTTSGSLARFLVLHTPGGSGSPTSRRRTPCRSTAARYATTSSAWRTRAAGPPGTMVPGRGHMRQALGRQTRPLMELPSGAHVADVSTGRVPSPCLREQLAGPGDESAGPIRGGCCAERMRSIVMRARDATGRRRGVAALWATPFAAGRAPAVLRWPPARGRDSPIVFVGARPHANRERACPPGHSVGCAAVIQRRGS